MACIQTQTRSASLFRTALSGCVPHRQSTTTYAMSVVNSPRPRGVAVYCGSSLGKEPAYRKAAVSVGTALARSCRPLIYGGGSKGIMGVVSGTAAEQGGEVVGVMPYAMHAAGGEREKTTEELRDSTVDTNQHSTRESSRVQTIVVNSMHERKVEMATRAGGFIGLPGGYGTYEEIFEVVTWTQLGIHDKPVVLLNVLGFYGPLREIVRNGVRAGFIQPANESLILFVDGPENQAEHDSFNWGEAAIRSLDSWSLGSKSVYSYDWTRVQNGVSEPQSTDALQNS